MFSSEELRRRADPQLSFKFICYIPAIDRLQEIDRTYIESVTFSYPDIAVEMVPFQNQYIKYAGRYNNPTVTIEFYEDFKSSVQKILQTWRMKIRKVDGTYSYPSDYKKNIRVDVVDGLGTKVSEIFIHNTFPTNANPIRLSYSEGGRVIVSQVFECEDVFIIDPNRSANITGSVEEITE